MLQIILPMYCPRKSRLDLPSIANYILLTCVNALSPVRRALKSGRRIPQRSFAHMDNISVR